MKDSKNRLEARVLVNIYHHICISDNMYPMHMAAESVQDEEWHLKSNSDDLCVGDSTISMDPP